MYFLNLQYPIVDLQQKRSCSDSWAVVAVSARGFQAKQVTAEPLTVVQL